MRRARSRRTTFWGQDLIEVLVAAAILPVGLLAALGAVPTGYFDAASSGGLSKATAYAQAQMEALRNQAFNPDPLTAGDSLEGGEFLRNWAITPIAGTAAPNRLVRIVVTVNWGGRGSPPQAVTLETMRPE